jgi:hypothetical protein
MDDVKGILEGARHLIETYGWIQGSYVSDDGFCLMGALYATPGWFREFEESGVAIEAVESAISDRCGEFTPVTRYNDSVATSKEEILGVLDEAISTL